MRIWFYGYCDLVDDVSERGREEVKEGERKGE